MSNTSSADPMVIIARARSEHRTKFVSALTLAARDNTEAADRSSHPEVVRIALANAKAADEAARGDLSTFRHVRIALVEAAQLLNINSKDLDALLETLD